MRNYGNLKFWKYFNSQIFLMWEVWFWHTSSPPIVALKIRHICFDLFLRKNYTFNFPPKNILLKEREKLFWWTGEELRTFEFSSTSPMFAVVNKALAKFYRNHNRSLFIQERESCLEKNETTGWSTVYPKYYSAFLSYQVHLTLISLIKSLMYPPGPTKQNVLWQSFASLWAKGEIKDELRSTC